MPTSTYYIYICGTERRNMICETLTINIQGKYIRSAIDKLKSSKN